MFDLINTILLFVVVIYVLLALFIYRKGRNRKIAVSYVVVIVSVIFWTLAMIAYRGSDHENSVSYAKLLYVLATFTASSFYFFSQIYPRGTRPALLKVFLVCLMNIAIISFVLLPNVIIRDVQVVLGSEKVIIWGRCYVLYFLFIAGLFSAGLLSLLLKLKHETGAEKLQLLYVFWGYFLGSSLAMTTNLLMVWWGDFRFNWLGQIFSLVMVGFTVYTILRFRLFGIRVLASKIYVTILVGMFFYTLYYVMIYFDLTFLDGPYSNLALIVGIPIAIAVAGMFIPFLNYIQRSSDIIFFRGHNPRKIIKDLSMKISSVIELKQLVRILSGELKKILGTDDVNLVFIKEARGAKGAKYVRLSVTGGGRTKEAKIKSSNVIYQKVLKIGITIVRDELDENMDKQLVREMDLHGAKIIAPLIVRKKVIGIILLGEKISQDAYTREDIEFLEIISAQAAIAIENARLYSETKDFNARLKKEIGRATSNIKFANEELTEINEKLTKAYEKLHKLDRAKSEFLSIASHQLRTPLTSIKGFTSLLLEGTYGKISRNVRSTLEKVYISNERLIKLVEDLLNISRIESGKIAFEFNKDNLESLTKEVVDSMKIAAKNKNLKLSYKPPKSKIKPFNFDRGKLREVVSNLIDNSIKYTKTGAIMVKLDNEEDIARITVEDTGMGISKGELEYIFDRFQRGKDVNQVHTEGIGLGLYVCKKIIEAHEGKLWAESEGMNKGSRFVVELKKNFKINGSRSKGMKLRSGI